MVNEHIPFRGITPPVISPKASQGKQTLALHEASGTESVCLMGEPWSDCSLRVSSWSLTT